MQKAIVCDTSCLILLDKIGELALLHRLFGGVLITKEIAEEFEQQIPDWIEIRGVVNNVYQRILQASLDKGEASAIALGIENSGSLLIIDDLKGRKYAEQLGLKITGTLGVLIEAKLRGHVESVKPLLEKIKETNFRLTRALEEKILAKALEL